MALIGSVAWRAPDAPMPLARRRNGRASHAGRVRPVRGMSCTPSQGSQLSELPTASMPRMTATAWPVPSLPREARMRRASKSRNWANPAGCPIMPEFLDDDFASDWSWTCQTLSADKRRVLDRARRDESQEVAKPAGRKDCDAVIDTKARGRYRERTSQPANMMAFGLSMMRPASNAWVTPREKTSN